METLKYSLKSHALKGITNAGTIKQYKNHLDRFAIWAKETHRIRLDSDVSDSRALAQEYADYLISSGYAPDSIHSYLAPVVKGFGFSLSDVQKPKRTASAIKKTRQEKANKQGRREMVNSKNARLVEAEKIIGVRRAELAKLTGECLARDYAGNLCILVRRGKGGKMQMQRILPKDISLIQQLFDGIGQKQKVFTKTELNNKISLHTLRRIHAQEAYDYYVGLIREGHRQEIIDDLKAYYLNYHAKQPGAAGERRIAKQYTRFCEDIAKGKGMYRLRGENKVRAKQAGRPTEYDRVALMAVSVFHLAHWRNDVTARNYMV